MPKAFGNPLDRGGLTIFTPADTGFNNQAVPLNNTNSGVAQLGNVMDVSAFDRCVIVSTIGAASSARLEVLILDENGVALNVVDGPGTLSFTLQQGFEIQDGSNPQCLVNVALIQLAVYGLSAATTATIRLFYKKGF